MAVRLSALRAGRPLPPRMIPGTHFCYRLGRAQSRSAVGRIMSIKKSNDVIGNRTRDFPACSIVQLKYKVMRSALVVRLSYVSRS
jgi:hypothetical protein